MSDPGRPRRTTEHGVREEHPIDIIEVWSIVESSKAASGSRREK